MIGLEITMKGRGHFIQGFEDHDEEFGFGHWKLSFLGNEVVWARVQKIMTVESEHRGVIVEAVRLVQ